MRSRTVPNRVVLSMTISGVTGELLAYHLLDDALIKAPRIQIDSPSALLAIQDAEFSKYTSEQKSNLLAASVSLTFNAAAKPQSKESK
jgi:hypothetical protein